MSNSNGECRLFVQDDFTRMSLDVLGECVFSYKINAIEEGPSMVICAFMDIFSCFRPGVRTVKGKIKSWFALIKWSTKCSRRHEQGIEIINVIRVAGTQLIIK